MSHWVRESLGPGLAEASIHVSSVVVLRMKEAQDGIPSHDYCGRRRGGRSSVVVV